MVAGFSLAPAAGPGLRPTATRRTEARAARRDFDGGIAGGCTFHLQGCVNNTDQPACVPGTRLASWELRKPSAAQAASRPALAAIRNALVGVVPQTLVGSSARDLCTPVIDVPVSLRGTAGHFKKGKVTLTTRAALYGGQVDSDKLSLECRPAP